MTTRRPRNRRQSMARYSGSQDGPTQQKTRLQTSRTFRNHRKTWTNGIQAQITEHVQSTPSLPRRQTHESKRRRVETSITENKAESPRPRDRRIHKLDGNRPRGDDPYEPRRLREHTMETKPRRTPTSTNNPIQTRTVGTMEPIGGVMS